MQYEIGNPLTAERMTRHMLAAGLYAPSRRQQDAHPETPVDLYGYISEEDAFVE
jgi:hypothetical protein